MDLKPSWKAEEEQRGCSVARVHQRSQLLGLGNRRRKGVWATRWKKKQIQVMLGNSCGGSQPWVSLPWSFWDKSQPERTKSSHLYKNLSLFRHHVGKTRPEVCSWSWTHPKEWSDFLNGACHGASSSAWLNSFINYVTNAIWMESKPGELGLDWKTASHLTLLQCIHEFVSFRDDSFL